MEKSLKLKQNGKINYMNQRRRKMRETFGLNVVHVIDVCWYNDPVESYSEVVLYQKSSTQTVNSKQ